MGVYCIKNSLTNIIFLGFASYLQAKFNRHKAELTFGSHRNKELQDAWNAHGESAFEFQILDELEHPKEAKPNYKEDLNILGELWVLKLKEAGNTVVYLKSR